ncbi:low-density lipoprotein receptor-related protein 8-like isoform X2 [Hippocampus comes]|nr:PREDICTED: low-density lipoprotein receptor-related protein 8-like isoform X1 [Hippocampus comes]XP_019731048.1 PREDICTED: low-density lipoprotein receptor-related protein 8-like isoform X2 [Hippocampus comes]
MGHLGGLFLLISCISQHRILDAVGHILPACHDQLEFSCKDGSCIPSEKRCDRHSDCDDGSDEQHCGQLGCKKDEFSCLSSRRCLPSRLSCNGVDDCGDGSDEHSCPSCAAGLFSCGPSDRCLHKRRLCDGHMDCKDGRDEIQELCGLRPASRLSAPSCEVSEFDCGDGQCVPHAWRCDNKADCSDASDEDNCEQNECLVNNGGCSHHCVDTGMGFHCECPDHMRLVGNSHCEEVDLCLESDLCDQMCVHINGTLSCGCLDGYQLSPTSGDCKAKGVDAKLLVSTSEGVIEVGFGGATSRTLAVNVPGPGPLAALEVKNILYMAQQGQGSIYRGHLSGEAQDATLALNVPGPISGLTLDWIHRLLFWTSLESDSIHVSWVDGSQQRQLLKGLDKPCALTVDPLHGLLFWAQCGSPPKILRVNLDGQDKMTLVTSLLYHPVALTLDMPRQLLYWLDSGMRSISRVKLDGRHRKTVVESNGYLDKPFGLAVFEGFVYWSDQDTRSICRANKHSGSDFQRLLTNVTSPGGIAIIHPALQPHSNAACGSPRRVCAHGCVVNLLSETPSFHCVGMGHNGSHGIPAISRAIPASRLSDPRFAGILSLIVFLSVLLVGTVLWWWREEFRPVRNLTMQSFSLEESQDPLIQDPRACLSKETPKLNLDSE